ncbi:MAG: threonine ammonia-lyase, biosynthetic [Planctomycetes bacterium]|nr:threonine ammonia-lyase, biosynthetic [Planctomycetota bacterium]
MFVSVVAASAKGTPMPEGYIERTLLSKVYDIAIETPLERANTLSRRYGNDILLKREDLQPVFSFKIRGAYAKMSKMTQAELAKGVIAASAGNHAQGVAMSARRLGVNATIVMPATTPQIKVDAVKAFGGTVRLRGDSYSDAYEYAMKLIEKSGASFIHPYDDPDVIAGQGTIGMELIRQHSDPIEAVFVPIGGGGLAAGVAAFMKRVRPEVKIIGVEPVDSDAMAQSIAKGRRVELADVGLFADGVAVRQVGKHTFRICRQLLDGIVLVDTDAICAAIKDVFEDTRTVMEPSGALAVAGAKQWARDNGVEGKTLVAILSGANMNFDRLRHVSERADLGECHEAILAATIPERPGAFRKLCSVLGHRAVTEFNYRYGETDIAHVFMGVRVNGRQEVDELLATLGEAGFEPVDFTDNEMAKIHIRYLVGGKAPGLKDERVFSFEFPERPGALSQFLNTLKSTWNISLFHYRNHGADYGRTLVGVQVPKQDSAKFAEFLRGIGYPCKEETDNLAYQLFLGK